MLKTYYYLKEKYQQQKQQQERISLFIFSLLRDLGQQVYLRYNYLCQFYIEEIKS